MGFIQVVKQGEHLSGIAKVYGFQSYNKIWNHAANTALKAKRKNPNVLLPRDEVFVPDREDKSFDILTDHRHRSKLSIERLFIKITVERAYAQPIAQTPCELIVDVDKFEITSDSSGLVEHEISATENAATLIVKDKTSLQKVEVPLDLRILLKIGYLDPVEDVSGQRARLRNLGYYRGEPDETDDAEKGLRC